MNKMQSVNIAMDADSRLAWNFLLQKGFYIQGQSGMTVRQFLVESLGYKSDFIDESVRTIFLNSSPVDDIDTVYIKDNDKLALGSAMPGLVGIVMGRDNPYKEFRSGIACSGGDDIDDSVEAIRVFMKIFSTLAVDTGADVLARGIEMDAGTLLAFLEKNKGSMVQAEGLEDIKGASNLDVHVSVTFV